MLFLRSDFFVMITESLTNSHHNKNKSARIIFMACTFDREI